MNHRDFDHHPSRPQRVAVLGLGSMGRALASALRQAGHDVVAWNRSPRTVDGLDVVPDSVDAVRDADVVLVCVRDHAGSRALISRVAPHVRDGAPVVNVSTGTSDEAEASAADAVALGIAYVTGAIMVPTPMIGTEHNLVLYAGPPGTIAAARPVLEALGGTVDVLGADHALPPVLDMAMLDMFFAGMYAFLHSAALARVRGVEPGTYLPYAEGILTTLAAELPGLAKAYEHGDYDRGQANLAMCLSFLQHIVTTSNHSGVDSRLPSLLRDLTLEQQVRTGDGFDWEVVAEGLQVRAAAT